MLYTSFMVRKNRMKKFLMACLIGLMTIGGTANAQSITRETQGYPVRITKVVDGDTFEIDSTAWSPFPNLRWRIRVRGIDTPEKSSKCLAEREAAKRMTAATLYIIERSQKRVWLQAVQHDKYGGRFDAVVVLVDGKSLGNMLIDSGLARPYLGGKRKPWCDSAGNLIP